MIFWAFEASNENLTNEVQNYVKNNCTPALLPVLFRQLPLDYVTFRLHPGFSDCFPVRALAPTLVSGPHKTLETHDT